MNMQTYWTNLSRQFRKVTVPARRWAKRYLPPGVRLLAGLLLIIGGALGFLPVLGFWMIPLGISIAALDVRPLFRWWRGWHGNDVKDDV